MKNHQRKSEQSQPPHGKKISAIPNGGGGDCAFIGIAQALAEASGKGHRAKPQEFSVGGRLQAQLRDLASGEMKKTLKNICWISILSLCNRHSLLELMQTPNRCMRFVTLAILDMRIWAFDDSSKTWIFFLPSLP